MKEIVLKLYEFDELPKDSQERIIEREHWNVMEQCMDAYNVDYKKSMEAFEDLTDTKAYSWKVGYERYNFSYEFKYGDPIYEHPTGYHRDIFLRIYAVNYCSGISITTLCHISRKVNIILQVNI